MTTTARVGWRGVIEEYRRFLPVDDSTPVITLQEGNTPLLHTPRLSERVGAEVYLKYEGLNPTGSFKDRGMTVAISKAVEEGAKAVVCASTGNTSASAAAYATRAGLLCVVFIPEGYIALGKLAQALIHGATVLQIRGNFDNAFALVRQLAEKEAVTVVNSVNPYRIEGQKSGAFEIVDVMGDGPDMHCIPVGNAGNITAYWKGYVEYREAGLLERLPKMYGFQAAGAAPIIVGHAIEKPDTVATAIRIGNPASWQSAVLAADESGGGFAAVTDAEILEAYRFLAGVEAVFCEPASAASVAGLIKVGPPFPGATVVCTLTGHGLKDPDRAIAEIAVPSPVDADYGAVRANSAFEVAVHYVICVPDGAADEPIAALDGRTPLEAAAMPHLAALAARGHVGSAATIPPGFPAGSDVGNLSILGYDPARYHTGRAPIEAAAMGVRLESDQVAYRCNLVTVGDDGTMVDFAGGHPSTPDAAAAIAAIERELGGGGIEFHAGVQYRHIMVVPTSWAEADCTPPHDLTGAPAVWPTGPAAPALRKVMESSRDVLAGFPSLAANQVWLWGQGPQPVIPSFTDTYGLRAGLVSAVDLVRGLGVLAGIPVIPVEGATGWYDTNYEGKRDACLNALAEGTDLFLIHVEASDEAGHAGNLEAKIEALENWDRRIIGPLVEGLDGLGPWRLLLMPDHPTLLRTRTHTPDPVPYLLVDSEQSGPGGTYSERAVAAAPAVPAHTLMARLVSTRG